MKPTRSVPLIEPLCVSEQQLESKQTTPELKDEHLNGISFGYTSYLMPWALYTIAPATIINGKMEGKLTEGGRRLVKKSLISLIP